MLDKIKDFLKKTPKGYIALPVAVVAVILATVIAIPFLGNDSGDSDNKDNVISFHDKENDDEDDDLEQDASTGNNDNSSNGSSDESEDNNGDDATDEGSSESGDDSQSGSDDSNSDANNGSSTDSNNGGTSSGTSSTGGSNNSGNTGTSGSGSTGSNSTGSTGSADLNVPGISLSEIPAYSGNDYIMLNDDIGNDKTIGIPYFSVQNLSTTAFEFYSELDSLGRCGVTYACLGPELLPTEERGDINGVTPSGWVSGDGSGNSLYNRSHLIAHALAGENDNPKNLITGTSHMNQYTMQIFENQVLDYIKETGNHVMYRVTPLFDGNNLVATGVLMEGWSIEDNGETICFNVFCYNIQEGVEIDYTTGNYTMIETNYLYIVNGKNGKIHTYECGIKSNMGTPIPCETLEEAQQTSKDVTGNSSPSYAGCCMSGYGYNHDGNVLPCHIENKDFITTRVLAIVINTKQHLLAA